MKIETKFSVGDKVYYLEDEIDYVETETCFICNGEGDIEVKEKMFQCPECKGLGESEPVSLPLQKTKGPKTIKAIITYTKKETEVLYHISSDLDNFEERLLFSTKEAAKAALRNPTQEVSESENT